MENIYVFKTNIKTKKDLETVRKLMSSACVADWNVDTEDIDCVLRIAGSPLSNTEIITLLSLAGYNCAELE